MTNGDHAAADHDTGAGDRVARMEWTNEGDGIFTLIVDDYRCKVWWAGLGDTWAAMVSQGGMATASYNFTTQAEAQSWCERQVPQP